MDEFVHHPIGFMKTCFSSKNGTPRQPTVSSVSKGELKIMKSVFNNPEHSLDGLSQYSHVWIIFVFHLNESKTSKAKVKPPRMNGLKTGIFSTRSPHRPNSVGLTLAKLETVDKDTIHLSGLDIVDGTPVLDIKPYIPNYDKPLASEKLLSGQPIPLVSNTMEADLVTKEDILKCKELNGVDENEIELTPQKWLVTESARIDEHKSYSTEVADWVIKPPIEELTVKFSNNAEENLGKFLSSKHSADKHETNDWTLEHISPDDLKQAIFDVLKADPRSSYRRKKCCDRLYYFTIDNAHITTWFDDISSPARVEVLRVVPRKYIDLTKQ